MPVLQPKPVPSPHALVEAHVDMARRIALKVSYRFPRWMDRDELIACAMVGLIEAAARFDPQRDETFPAFAAKRVRGAVLDELRRGDVMTRRGRQEARRARRVVDDLEQELGRAPDEGEVAGALGMSVERYLDERPEVAATTIELSPAIAATLACAGEDVASRLVREEQVARVHAALGRLPERDALILSLYYLEELTFLEIAEVLDLSESRVCQLHGRARERLRDACRVEDVR